MLIVLSVIMLVYVYIMHSNYSPFEEYIQMDKASKKYKEDYYELDVKYKQSLITIAEILLQIIGEEDENRE